MQDCQMCNHVAKFKNGIGISRKNKTEIPNFDSRSVHFEIDNPATITFD